MNRTNFVWIFLLNTVIASIGTLTTIKRVAAEDNQDEIRRLTKTWEEQEGQIANGVIHGYMFRFFDESASAFTPEQVDLLINKIGQDVDENKLDQIFDQANTGNWKKDKSYLWNVGFSISFDGNKVKNSFDTKNGNIIRCYDGTQEISLDPSNSQIRIDAGSSAIEKLGLKDFQLIPPQTFKEKISAYQIQKKGANPALISLSTNTSALEIDTENARIIRVTKKNIDGSVKNNRTYQYNIKSDSGMFFLPRLICDYKVEKQHVEMATFLLVTAFDFNVEFSEDEFKVGIPAKHTVFDYRANPKKPVSVRVNTSADDAVKFIENRKKEKSGHGENYYWLVVPWVLMALVIIFYKIMKSKIPKNRG